MDDFTGGLFLRPGELVQQIEAYGFSMFIGEDGVVHGRALIPGKKIPFEMQPLLDQLRLQNEAVAEILRNRQQEVVELKGVTAAEAQPWLDKVKAGEYRLVPGTNVTYVRATGLAYFKLEKVKPVE